MEDKFELTDTFFKELIETKENSKPKNVKPISIRSFDFDNDVIKQFGNWVVYDYNVISYDPEGRDWWLSLDRIGDPTQWIGHLRCKSWWTMGDEINFIAAAKYLKKINEQV
jgi:hypothetical protein